MMRRKEMAHVITVENFTKKYGGFTAVDNISFTVDAGEIFGFLGPNGAGKSTTINTLCTILGKTAGKITLNGHDIETEKDLVRKDIGIVFQDSTLDARLTVEENLRYHCEFYLVPRSVVKERIDSVLDLVELQEWRRSPVGGLSGGMKRRVEIARGLVHSPKVLFLDEPTSGLDPHARAAVWTYIKNIQREQGLTIFMTTHYMDESEICSSVSIMNKGRIAASGSPAELQARFATSMLDVTTKRAPELAAFLAGENIHFTENQGRFRIAAGTTEKELHILSLFRESITSFDTDRGSMDDVFLAITQKREAV
jgi:ABC-2 type transport system ATP-binding protein